MEVSKGLPALTAECTALVPEAPPGVRAGTAAGQCGTGLGCKKKEKPKDSVVKTNHSSVQLCVFNN